MFVVGHLSSTVLKTDQHCSFEFPPWGQESTWVLFATSEATESEERGEKRMYIEYLLVPMFYV